MVGEAEEGVEEVVDAAGRGDIAFATGVGVARPAEEESELGAVEVAVGVVGEEMADSFCCAGAAGFFKRAVPKSDGF
jgi:hypothetical protein